MRSLARIQRPPCALRSLLRLVSFSAEYAAMCARTRACCSCVTSFINPTSGPAVRPASRRCSAQLNIMSSMRRLLKVATTTPCCATRRSSSALSGGRPAPLPAGATPPSVSNGMAHCTRTSGLMSAKPEECDVHTLPSVLADSATADGDEAGAGGMLGCPPETRVSRWRRLFTRECLAARGGPRCCWGRDDSGGGCGSCAAAAAPLDATSPLIPIVGTASALGAAE
mmetsp:Transcript_41895/g.106054  ORF Transcript_41895/g.106054 Transcript_41895/m.106054 type:complete len:226 (+) Transcript_41895:628-1305(+)